MMLLLQQINQRSALLEEKLKRTARNSSQFKVQNTTTMSRIADFLHISAWVPMLAVW